MVLAISNEDNTLVVTGELDRFGLSELSKIRFPIVQGDVTLDLKNVQHTDTAGLAWLLKLVNFYQNRQHQISIVNLSEQLIALATISNVLELLPIKGSEQS